MVTTKKTRKPVKQKVVESTEGVISIKVIEEAQPAQVTEALIKKVPKVKLVVEVDDSVLSVLEIYTKRWNGRHEDPAYTPIGPAEFLLYATLKWCEYEERGVVGLERVPGEDDVVPEVLKGITHPNPDDDDPEFVDAFVSRLGAR